MRVIQLLSTMLILVACEELDDIKTEKGPCTIELSSGGTVVSHGDIRILESTGTLTYRDEEGNLWSLTEIEYSTYSCGN
jgi:hypothetical protein